MYQQITVRQGGTFRRGGKVQKPGDNPRDKPVPVDITGWGISAVVKKDAKTIAALQVTVVDASKGTYEMYYANTSGWPLGELSMDICYQMNDPLKPDVAGDVVYTPTVTVVCTKTDTPRPAP